MKQYRRLAGYGVRIRRTAGAEHRTYGGVYSAIAVGNAPFIEIQRIPLFAEKHALASIRSAVPAVNRSEAPVI
jgi:hypothetical protein